VNKGLYTAVNGMASAQKRLEIISDNLANLSTTAFKRRVSGTESFESALRGGRAPMLRTSGSVVFEQGTLLYDDNPSHFALFGEGFFAVEGPQGELLTRDGTFHVAEDGVLRTQEGFPLAWARRKAPIDPKGERVRVSASGVAMQGVNELGRLRVVDYEDTARLSQVGGAYFRAPAGLSETPHRAIVQQGALEGSNSNSVREIVELVEVQRAFELAANTLTQIDKSYQRLVRSS